MKKTLLLLLLSISLVSGMQANQKKKMAGYTKWQIIGITSSYWTKKKTLKKQNIIHNLGIERLEFIEDPEDYNNFFYKVKDYVFYSIIYSNKYTRNLANLKDILAENESTKQEYSDRELSKEELLITSFNEDYNEAVNEFIKTGLKGQGKLKLIMSVKDLIAGLKNKLNGNVNTIYKDEIKAEADDSQYIAEVNDNMAPDEELWSYMRSAKIGLVYEKFIRKYPNSEYVKEAKLLAKKHQNDQGILGVWKTSWGTLEMEYDDETDMFFGHYQTNEVDANVVGYMEDDVFSGYWIESNGSNTCEDEVMASLYWGNVTLNVKNNSFSGQWAHCNQAFSNKQTINGSKQ